jgi:uncharacterized repeat protein (TIGR03806 family)
MHRSLRALLLTLAVAGAACSSSSSKESSREGAATDTATDSASGEGSADDAGERSDAGDTTSAGSGSDTSVLPPQPDRPRLDSPTPLRKLSEYAFFVGPLREMRPNNGVIGYSVNAPLWSDNAYKGRYIVMPEGGQLTPVTDGDEDWQLPVGSIVIKTFYFDLDRTTPDEGPYRLLFVTARGIVAETYLWNEEQTEAVRFVAGSRINMQVIGTDGASVSQEYVVPNKNQCANCHSRNDKLHMLGLTTAQLNRESLEEPGRNQLELWQSAGMIAGDLGDTALLPAYDKPFVSGSLNGQARAYLHGNCSHCHRTGGDAGVTGLWLLASVTDDYRLGICKGPVAAGAGTGSLHYDILPGFPERSIMPFRMSSVDPEIKMPEIPNLIADQQGLALIESWIAAMPPVACNEVNEGSGAGAGSGSGQ